MIRKYKETTEWYIILQGVYFLSSKYYKYALLSFLIYSFDNDNISNFACVSFLA